MMYDNDLLSYKQRLRCFPLKSTIFKLLRLFLFLMLRIRCLELVSLLDTKVAISTEPGFYEYQREGEGLLVPRCNPTP
jgi:hypothetical protein